MSYLCDLKWEDISNRNHCIIVREDLSHGLKIIQPCKKELWGLPVYSQTWEILVFAVDSVTQVQSALCYQVGESLWQVGYICNIMKSK